MQWANNRLKQDQDLTQKRSAQQSAGADILESPWNAG